jgi:hypothetical protein
MNSTTLQATLPCDQAATQEDMRAHVDARDKYVRDLQARFALVGHTAHVTAGGGVLVSKWGHVRECATFEEAAHMLKLIEGK